MLSSAGNFHTQVRSISHRSGQYTAEVAAGAAATSVLTHSIGVSNVMSMSFKRVLVRCRALLVGVLAGVATLSAVSAPKAFAMDIREAQKRCGNIKYCCVSLCAISWSFTNQDVVVVVVAVACGRYSTPAAVGHQLGQPHSRCCSIFTLWDSVAEDAD